MYRLDWLILWKILTFWSNLDRNWYEKFNLKSLELTSIFQCIPYLWSKLDIFQGLKTAWAIKSSTTIAKRIAALQESDLVIGLDACTKRYWHFSVLKFRNFSSQAGFEPRKGKNLCLCTYAGTSLR